mmetsp:Transcript_22843/g.65666  ORF Transcript_22843/g.65666 Transcript_22843/m.65666 type:complete len:456 (-) Transcript_22843:36-1403(-)
MAVHICRSSASATARSVREAPQRLAERVRELEVAEAAARKAQAKEEKQRQREFAEAKKRVTKEVQAAARLLQKEERGVNRIATRVEQAEKQAEQAKAKASRQQTKIEESMDRLRAKRADLETTLHSMMSNVGEARGRLAHATIAAKMLEEGLIPPVGGLVSGLATSPGAQSTEADSSERLLDENRRLRAELSAMSAAASSWLAGRSVSRASIRGATRDELAPQVSLHGDIRAEPRSPGSGVPPIAGFDAMREANQSGIRSSASLPSTQCSLSPQSLSVPFTASFRPSQCPGAAVQGVKVMLRQTSRPFSPPAVRAVSPCRLVAPAVRPQGFAGCCSLPSLKFGNDQLGATNMWLPSSAPAVSAATPAPAPAAKPAPPPPAMSAPVAPPPPLEAAKPFSAGSCVAGGWDAQPARPLLLNICRMTSPGIKGTTAAGCSGLMAASWSMQPIYGPLEAV